LASHRPVAPAAAPHAAPAARVLFLYIAQAHQTLHSLSAAIELARRRPDIAVDVAATTPGVLDYAWRTACRLPPAPIQWRLLGPAWLRSLRLPVFGEGDDTPPKLPMLAANARLLAGYDVIVAPERTTAALRRLGVKAKLVYTQHGAGDRKGPFEPRLKRFDLVFAAGPKQRDRMVGSGLVAPDHCAVVGYPKFDIVDALCPQPPRLFADDRPVVLYNPHFSPKLGSWPAWGRQVLEAFAGQARYNLIFAPHLRLFHAAEPQSVAELAAFLGRPGIHIDLGAGAGAIDMTYTRRADVYLGDVSSQVYEFLRTPRPCLFLNAHHLAWRDDESFRHWTFGPVLDSPDHLIDAVDRARATFADYAAVQAAAFADTFDLAGPSSSVRAAEAIAGLVGPVRR
jgi:hypothetical protein